MIPQSTGMSKIPKPDVSIWQVVMLFLGVYVLSVQIIIDPPMYRDL